MSIQIQNIVLYNYEGDIRTIEFQTDAVNIISGESSTGKSALIDIVDYCLASGECRVPIKKEIRNTIAWYGLKLKLPQGELFIARRSPELMYSQSSDFYYEEGKKVEIPIYDKLKKKINTEGMQSILSSLIGITPNETLNHHYSNAFELTVRHALKFCYQYQDEIANKRIIFHRQAEAFINQALALSIPYFVGAVTSDYPSLKKELQRLYRKQKRLVKQIEEEKAIIGDYDKAEFLAREAVLVGLFPPTQEIENNPNLVAELQKINIPENYTTLSDMNYEPEIILQQDQLEKDRARENELTKEINATLLLLDYHTNYESMSQSQIHRLKLCESFSDINDVRTCPLCAQAINEILPACETLNEELRYLQENVSDVSKRACRINEYLDKLKNERALLQESIYNQENAIRKLINDDNDYTQHMFKQVQVGIAYGKIQLYLESIEGQEQSDSLECQLKKINKEIKIIMSKIGRDKISAKVKAIEDKLSVQMTKWAIELGIEYANDIIKLELENLMIKAITNEGHVPLYNMGSGKNWVELHLIALFALHKYFYENNCPVPRFLILDQPTQVFYPPEKDSKDGAVDDLLDTDREAVSKMFSWIFDNTKGFQVIITDHANLKDERFKKALADEPWRHGKRLVPTEWYEAEKS